MYGVLEHLMTEKGISPYRLSKETGIAASSLSDWKLGKSKPKADKLKILADYFGVSMEAFLPSTQAKRRKNA